MEMNATQKDAANVLGRSARWLNDQDKAPRNKDKTYPLPELVAWFVGREVASDPLKDEKLKAEIGVLKERLPAHRLPYRRSGQHRRCDVDRRTTFAVVPR